MARTPPSPVRAPAHRVTVGSAAPVPVVRAAGRRRRRSPPGTQAALGIVLVVAVAAGSVARLWYLTHQPIDADEAVVGTMARHILAGHLHAFYPGQSYGGVEPYLVAAVFAVAGPSTVALRVVPVLLSAGACLLLWRLARRVVQRPVLAVAVAVALWVAPQAAVWNSTLEYGFRGVTMVCGLALLLSVRRAVDGDRPGWDLVVAGLTAGVGWWSSPEIVYFAVPAAWWLGGWVVRRRPGRRLVPWAATSVAGAALGALPWLWDNVGRGFPSLDASAYYVPAVAPGYGGRLAVFARDVFPLLLDLRVPDTGRWLVPPVLGAPVAAVAAAILVAAVARCLRGGGAGAGLAAGVVACPLLLALVPGSWLWESGRYAVFLVPLALLVVARAVDDRGPPTGRRPAARASAALAALLLLATGLSVADGAALGSALVPPGVRLGPGGPDGVAMETVADLERARITEGYADYWVAYTLDFLAGGRLAIADSPPSPDRWPALGAEVAAAPAGRQAWIFVPATASARAEYADSVVIRGPGGLPERSFLADLAALGIAHRTETVGPVEVVRCARPVTFAEVGLRPH